jgi:5-epi-alpha-selinene synthase
MAIHLNDLCYLRKGFSHDAIRIHPYWPRVHELVRETAIKFNVVQDQKKFDASQFVLHAAICYADEDMSVEFLTLLTEWHMWLWTFDDRIDDGDLQNDCKKRAIIFDQLYRVLDVDFPVCMNNISDGNVLLLKHIIDKIMQINIDILKKKIFIATVQDYLNVNTRGTRRKCKDLHSLIEIRLQDSAVNTCLALVKIYALMNSKTTQLCESYYDLVELNRQCNAIITLSNDIFSYEKEIEENNDYNILLAIKKSQNISLENAVIVAKNMLNTYWQRFERLASYYKMTSKRSDPMRKYVDIMYNWIIGSTYWSMYISLRYKSSTSPFVELRL